MPLAYRSLTAGREGLLSKIYFFVFFLILFFPTFMTTIFPASKEETA